MGMSNVLLSITEIKDLHSNATMELNLLHQVQNPSNIVANEEITTVKVKNSWLHLGGLNAVTDEDNEGFKTPPLQKTTLKECPPAPRKAREIPALRSPEKKRKLSVTSSPARTRRVILLDYSDEVEAMFPLAIRRNFYGKIRKVGGEENRLWLQK